MSRWSQQYKNYWTDFRISQRKLQLFRFFFFLVIGIDAWLQVAHAPRYGAGDFNVTHFPGFLSWLPVPSRDVMTVLFVIQGYIAIRIALGASHRLFTGTLALLFGVSYFISQLNSYQHQYLVFLILVLLHFAPWRSDRPPWALRLVIVQISLVYVFAAVAKMDPGWLDGAALQAQLGSSDIGAWIVKLTGGDTYGYRLLAVFVMLLELVLAVCVLFRPLWRIAWPLGVLFHISIEFTPFQIGLFSYVMLALYILLIPTSWLARVDQMFRALDTSAAADTAPVSAFVGRRVLVALLVGALGAAALAWLPFSVAPWIAGAVAVLFVVESVFHLAQPLRTRSISHAVTTTVLLFFSLTTNTVADHYRRAGGSAQRLGDLSTAKELYGTLARVRPETHGGHRGLGLVANAEGKPALAIKHLHTALEKKPGDDLALASLAQAHTKLGNQDEALKAARAALASNPRNRLATRILAYWQRRSAEP